MKNRNYYVVGQNRKYSGADCLRSLSFSPEKELVEAMRVSLGRFHFYDNNVKHLSTNLLVSRNIKLLPRNKNG